MARRAKDYEVLEGTSFDLRKRGVGSGTVIVCRKYVSHLSDMNSLRSRIEEQMPLAARILAVPTRRCKKAQLSVLVGTRVTARAAHCLGLCKTCVPTGAGKGKFNAFSSATSLITISNYAATFTMPCGLNNPRPPQSG
jgi:hypothetical protein